MRRYLLEALAVTLVGGSLVFFYECVVFLTRRDYLAAIIIMFVGLAVIRVGAEVCRLALVQKE